MVHPHDRMDPAAEPLLPCTKHHAEPQNLDVGEFSPCAFIYEKFRTGRIHPRWGWDGRLMGDKCEVTVWEQ